MSPECQDERVPPARTLLASLALISPAALATDTNAGPLRDTGTITNRELAGTP